MRAGRCLTRLFDHPPGKNKRWTGVSKCWSINPGMGGMCHPRNGGDRCISLGGWVDVLLGKSNIPRGEG